MGLSDGIVLDMEFREGTGTVTKDKSGEGNDGTLVNTPAWIAGGGLDFDAASQEEGDCGNDASLDITAALTVAVKVKVNASTGTTQSIIGKSIDAPHNTYEMMYLNAGQFNFYMGGTISVNSSKAVGINLGQTYIVIGRWDGVNNDMFLDGRWVDKAATPLPPNSDVTEPVRIATRNGNSRWLDGCVYKARIYNRALSEQEVRQLYDEWRTPKLGDGVVLDMDFKAGSGVVAFDRSGYQNHGAFGAGAAAPTWVAGGGLVFDGDAYVEVPNDASLQIADAITIAIKFNCTNAGGASEFMVCKGTKYDTQITGDDFMLGLDVGAREFTRSSDDVLDATDHIVITTYDKDDGSNVAKIYLDGRQPTYSQQESHGGAAIETDASVLYIGRRNDGYYFIGTIARVRIYNRKLSEHEVARLTEMWL